MSAYLDKDGIIWHTPSERRVSRDEFALAAMAALIAHPQSISPSGNEAVYAAGSYALADAMIAERDKKAGG